MKNKPITKEQYKMVESILDSLGAIYSNNPLEEKAYRILRLNGMPEEIVIKLLKENTVVQLSK